MGVSFKSGVADENSKRLISGHAYAITNIGWGKNKYIYATIRNPWGDESFTTRGYTKKIHKSTNLPRKAHENKVKDKATFVMELNDLINNIKKLQYLS